MGCRLSVNRFDAIDGTRGILAGMVMLSHMFGSFMGWPQVRPFSGAYLCVVYFFIMSGFVLTYAHASGNFFKYVLTICPIMAASFSVDDADGSHLLL